MSDVLDVETIFDSAVNEGENELHSLTLLPHVGSTNDWCTNEVMQGRSMPFACVTDEQNKGRGRRGRQWFSASRKSIIFSIASAIDGEMKDIGLFSLYTGMGVVDVLRRYGMSGVGLKWPNDVLVSDKKIAGVLIESYKKEKDLNVIVGIGMNYESADEVKESAPEGASEGEIGWSDVLSSFDVEPEGGRNRLMGSLIAECLKRCRDYKSLRNEISATFDSDYNLFINQQVAVSNDTERFIGKVIGTTTDGLLELDCDGSNRIFASGDVSLRKTERC